MWVRSLGEDAAEAETRAGDAQRPGSAARSGHGRWRAGARAGGVRWPGPASHGGTGLAARGWPDCFTVREVGEEVRQWG
jgi:hypothetical protein